jgi:AcrR family transcriptional regulator
VAGRRSGIADAARRLLVERGLRGLSFESVATVAGVTRKTVYNHFGSKPALLDVTAERAGVHLLHDACEHPDPVAAATALINASCQFWAADRVVFRRLAGLTAIDPDVSDAVAERERGRARQWTTVVARLRDAGRLRRNQSREEAVRVLAVLTGFPMFDGLTPPGGSPAATGHQLFRLADTVIDLGTRC